MTYHSFQNLIKTSTKIDNKIENEIVNKRKQDISMQSFAIDRGINTMVIFQKTKIKINGNNNSVTVVKLDIPCISI